MSRERAKSRARPLDAKALDEAALRYVSRFSTTRAKLRDYLRRKIAERGWVEGPPADVDGLVERLNGLGYIDDRAFAVAKANAHQARGLGARRLAQALRAAGVEDDDQAPALDQADLAAIESALRFARRRRLGPFAQARADDPRIRERAIAAFIRAGHAFSLARRIVAMDPDDDGDMQNLINTVSHTIQ